MKTQARRATYEGQPVRTTTILCVAVAVLSLTTVYLTVQMYGGALRGLYEREPVEERVNPEKKCAFPIVYNKAPKTASSFLKAVITNWSKEIGRPVYKCPSTNIRSGILLPDCVPAVGPLDDSSCGVLATHLVLNANAKALLAKRMPEYKVIASTRYPPHRIISLYMFNRKIHSDDRDLEKGLKYYLDTYNPWHQFNYLTGEARTGECPLDLYQLRDITSLVSTFDIIVDVNLRHESNVILKHFNLFEIPDQPDLSQRLKEFGAVRANISAAHMDLLKQKACVEFELHRAMLYRMASLYEKATGNSCIRGDTMNSCISEKEEDFLKSSWTLDYSPMKP